MADNDTPEDYEGMVEELDGQVETVFDSGFQYAVEDVTYPLSQGELPSAEEFVKALTALTELEEARTQLWSSLYLIGRHLNPELR